MRFFFQQEEIAVAKQVGGSQSADAAADDHHIVAGRDGRPFENLCRRVPDGKYDCLRCPLRGCGVSAASRERSIGHPAATDPATTNLMKSLRFVAHM